MNRIENTKRVDSGAKVWALAGCSREGTMANLSPEAERRPSYVLTLDPWVRVIFSTSRQQVDHIVEVAGGSCIGQTDATSSGIFL